jgi:hypothetical protein
MGAQIPMFAEKPFVSCGCKKFKVDALGDHLNTLFVPITRVPRRLTTGRLVNLLTFFTQHIQQKLNRWLEAGDSIVGTWSSWDIW